MYELEDALKLCGEWLLNCPNIAGFAFMDTCATVWLVFFTQSAEPKAENAWYVQTCLFVMHACMTRDNLDSDLHLCR
jgi:hypothetical protein